MTHIFIPSDQKIAHEKHNHYCPIGKHVVSDEPNTICQKTLRGTGLEQHTFPCMVHVADWRTRFGIDDIVDVYLEVEQARRFRHEWDDARVAKREEVEAHRNPDLRAVLKEPE